MVPPTLTKARAAALATLLTTSLAVLAGCGGDDDDAATGPTEPVTDITITSPDLSFDIERFSVPVGEDVRVTYVNDDEGVQHNIRFDTGEEPEPATEIVTGPETRDVTFALDEPGEVTYICDVHPAQMRGTVTGV